MRSDRSLAKHFKVSVACCNIARSEDNNATNGQKKQTAAHSYSPLFDYDRMLDLLPPNNDSRETAWFVIPVSMQDNNMIY